MHKKKTWCYVLGYRSIRGILNKTVEAETREEALREILYRQHVAKETWGEDTVLFTETLREATPAELKKWDDDMIARFDKWVWGAMR